MSSSLLVAQSQSLLTCPATHTPDMSQAQPSLLLRILLLIFSPAASRPASDLSLLAALRANGASQSWGLKVPDRDMMQRTLR